MTKPFLSCLILMLLSITGFYAQTHPFQNQDLPAEERIDNILSLMTIGEKIECLGTDPAVPRLGIQGCGHVEGLHGLAMGEPGGWGTYGDKAPIATSVFPQSIGMGCTWDTASMRLMGRLEAYEMRYLYQSPKYKRGALVLRAPNSDLGRDPRWGRNEECYGEDPFFNGAMSVAFIQGLQGDHPRYWQAASLIKHFLANSNENTRAFSSSNFDERLLREYYALPFKMGITEGGARAYMAAYNKVNEVPMMVSPLLKELTVKEWGQNGIICTDGGALKLLISHHKYYKSLDMGAAVAVKMGINQFLDDHKQAVRNALDKGILSEAEIDNVLRGNFRVMLKLGLLDAPEGNPYAKIGSNNETEPWLTPKHKQAVLNATRKSVVLLKNDNNTLPLKSKELKSVLVVGRQAKEVWYDWYSGQASYTVSPLQGIQSKLGKKTKLTFIEDNTDSTALATAAAAADLVIACVGNHPTGDAGWEQVTRPSYGKEAVDRKTLVLEDEAMIRDLYEVNQNVVMVLLASFPYAINWSQHNLPAIVHATHGSQELGTAVADVLFGDYNPAGRLVQTWPVSDSLLLPLLDYDIRKGRTYMYDRNQPLYPFGYGLSYTSFKYQNLKVDAFGDHAVVSFAITNTGTMDGDEVAQVYIAHKNSLVDRPTKELKGFARHHIKKGETERISITIPYERLKYWDSDQQAFVLEKDLVQIKVGASSAHIRLQGPLEW